MAGFFLTFEGIDGSGKSTQAGFLADKLRKQGCEVVLTREPGGSVGADQIRKLLVEGKPDRWSVQTELLLFFAARRDHLEKTIMPALEAGKIVISDRFVDSTRVYQGVRRGNFEQNDLVETVNILHKLMIGIESDLTLIIDTDPVAAFERTKKRSGHEERYESFGLEFQRRLSAGFKKLEQSYPTRCQVIDGHGSAMDVAERVYRAVKARL